MVLSTLVLVPLLLATGGEASAADQKAATPTIDKEKNGKDELSVCVILLGPVTVEDYTAKRANKVKKQACYASEEEKSKAIKNGEFGTTAIYTLLKWWEHSDRGGRVAEVTTDVNCSWEAGYIFWSDNVGDFWNDRASSAEPYCGRTFRFYEHANRNPGDYGDYRNIAGYDRYLGAMNDNMTSWGMID